jgi:hypothetical protein
MTFEIPKCYVCGTEFDNIFDAIDHLVEDGGEEEFDPKITLPSGYSLLVGSLLRELYDSAYEPERIRTLTQLTFGTLYAASNDAGSMKKLIEDAIVYDHMSYIDEELQDLLEETDNESDGKG